MKREDLKKIKKLLKKAHLENIDFKWIIIVTIIAFLLSAIFSLFSELVIPNVNIPISITILIIFIFIGIIFDMIGVSVQSADTKPFHAMSAKKIKGSKTAVSLKKSADKTSSLCNDVVGDICGIISGAIGYSLTSKITNLWHTNELLTFLIITSIVSALTIGGKALGKTIAINKSNYILYNFSKFIGK